MVEAYSTAKFSRVVGGPGLGPPGVRRVSDFGRAVGLATWGLRSVFPPNGPWGVLLSNVEPLGKGKQSFEIVVKNTTTFA